jgi:hypothetical protein
MRRRAKLLFVLLLIATGCANFRIPIPFVGGTPRGIRSSVTLQQLSEEVSFQANSFAAWVSSGAEDIGNESTIRRVRRNALVWRLQMIPWAQRAAAHDDPRVGYLQSLLVATLQLHYFEVGDGRELFGAQQGIAIDVARRLEQQAIEIGQRFLTNSEMNRVLGEVTQYAKQFPIQGREFSMQRALSGSVQLQESEIISSFLSIPLAPFRALEGVDSGAQAIREFNITARRFTDVVAQMPEQLRGELDLFMYDFEDRDTVTQGLSAFKTVAESADRASLTIAELPEDLRINLQQTLQESQGTVAKLSAAVDQLRALVGPLDSASASLRDASIAWREVIGSYQERNAQPDTGPPFDVRDWGNAASQIGTAAGELRGLAVDVSQIDQSSALTAALDRSVDRLFWRGAALIAVFFGALLVYRLIASRVARSA